MSTLPRNCLQIIEESWAREALVSPYHVYLKMAYHLSHEARAGLGRVQKSRGCSAIACFDFQAAAVKIAAHHLNKRNGVADRRCGWIGQDPYGNRRGPNFRGRLWT